MCARMCVRTLAARLEDVTRLKKDVEEDDIDVDAVLDHDVDDVHGAMMLTWKMGWVTRLTFVKLMLMWKMSMWKTAC